MNGRFQLTCRTVALLCVLSILHLASAQAGVGDPQIATDHPWYPGELASSTFPRLQETQAKLYERVVGQKPTTDQQRALAAWMWRNIHYAHGEEGKQDVWGRGFRGGDTTTREYWTGLYAHGFGLCGTTHAQWTAELNELLGHGRSRTVGVVGHNALEVYLTGEAYGSGRWALLDHDVSTVVFDPTGNRLVSIKELSENLQQLTDPEFHPERQQGWPLGGLHPGDPQAYAEFNVVEHLPGYAGPPPMIHLRSGETLRRYHQPGLEDGETFVFWGRNYRAEGIPGPERSRTWVNQPERFRGTPEGSGYRQGQARYGNAVYTYRPDFTTKKYREGLLSENESELIFEFRTPYIIAATPADDSDWGIYNPGCKNGLQVRGLKNVPVSVSVDAGTTWHSAGMANGSFDLTDHVKGSQQYWLKLQTTAEQLRNQSLEIVTVCQANPALFPRLKENGTSVEFAASGQRLRSAGPTRPHAESHVIAGGFETPRVTLELRDFTGQPLRQLYAAAHVASSNPPDPNITYQIEYSRDEGRSWQPVVQDWSIVRQGEETQDFWSQSFCYGDIALPTETADSVQVRFRNNGGKRYLRAEAHLVAEALQTDACRVTFAWTEADGQTRKAQQTFTDATSAADWKIDTGSDIQMRWVEFEAVSN